MTNESKRPRNRHKPATSITTAPPAYFLSVEVENALCFKDRQVLDLSDGSGSPAQWTVILGDNGVGKTTLLRCLNSMEMRSNRNNDILPLLFAPYLSESFSTWQELGVLSESEARVISRVICGSVLSSFKTSTNRANKRRLESRRVNVEAGAETYWGVSDSSVNLKGLLCYGYGATRKMGQTFLGENIFEENSISLFSEDQSLINAEEWLLQIDYAIHSASGIMRSRLTKQLNQIKNVLKKLLPEITNVRIALANEEQLRPRAEFRTPYGWVPLNSLGLGYRTVTAWMVDLAVRLFRRYPDSEDPLAEPAIVLVDEIDLHLHPKWQRNIMSFLTERFPNTQFIVTAHSPLVVQAAADANIVLLRREGNRVVIDNNPEIVDNWRVDQVLTSVFELPTARPVDLEPMLARRQELLAKARLSKADEAELQELEAEIGSLPTAETPDDIKAMDIIRRAAKLLENS
jgi:predicted ATP-binding protein involved in virulence